MTETEEQKHSRKERERREQERQRNLQLRRDHERGLYLQNGGDPSGFESYWQGKQAKEIEAATRRGRATYERSVRKEF